MLVERYYHKIIFIILTAFDPYQLDGRPQDQVMSTENKLASMTLSCDELSVTQQLINKCHSYCRVSS